ncbi:MAG: hypothetical protein IJT64_06975 [Kiritimatiellae bacterium]|nr:hypothetical protein [Kiritimatiellia bacterium]
MNSRSVLFSLCAASAIALTGCDWGSSGDNNWNDSYAWANFTGTYRFTKAIIASAASDSESGSEESSSVATITAHGAANTAMTSTTQAGGTLSPVGTGGITPGSVKIKVLTSTIVDDGSGNLTLNGGNIGTIKYDSGVWSFTTSGIKGSAKGTAVSITWDYTTSSGASTKNDKSGSTQTTIPLSYLNVVQRGNKLTMTGDSGIVYSGQLTGASMGSEGYVAAQTVYLSFSVSSASGGKITGSLSGNWSGAGDKSYGTMSNRQIHGTLSNGTTFVGTAADVTISVPTVSVSE